MLRRLAYVFALLLFVLPALGHAQSFDPTSPKPNNGLNWRSFEQAVEVASKNDKAILVDIYAPSCPWCRKMQQDVYTDDQVQQYLDEHFEVARLNATNTTDEIHFQEHTLNPQQLAVGLGMQGTPTTVFLNPDGSYIAHVPGFVEAPRFQMILKYVGSGAHTEQDFQQFVESQKEQP